MANVLLGFILPFSVLAQATNIQAYDCKLLLIAKDLPAGSDDRVLRRPAVSPDAHGGKEVEVIFGDHTLSVLADGKWRGISWSHQGKLVAETLNVTADPIAASAVMITYNPRDREELVSLSCEPSPSELK